MPAALDPPADLLEAAVALDPDRFDRLVAGLLRVRAERVAGTVRGGEAALLARINGGPSPDVWSEYHRLRDRHRRQVLTPAEYAELTRLTDTVELYQADRTAALVELAAVRGEPLDQVLRALGIPWPASG
ncbi:hypothetical protein [Urbifossiella limnaea]|uniref:STAS/SEC14 domain-containing protein n=1 Tax=Urbifossiella limnaea TaxID=2528023 RepID=A0A517Y0L8_9BACT|nr:hypothetical protein [Urbifossiella limnaea]QDU23291.1 hypothetical protein ETAA1_52850 [Urbifossiella limnaea]